MIPRSWNAAHLARAGGHKSSVIERLSATTMRGHSALYVLWATSFIADGLIHFGLLIVGSVYAAEVLVGHYG
jgi:hypothetical protein